MVPEPNPDMIYEFLLMTFGRLPEGQVGILFRSQENNKRWTWWFDVNDLKARGQEAARYIARRNAENKHVDTMTALAADKLPTHRAGGDADISYTSTIAADFDGEPDEVEAFLTAIENVKPSPTMVVSSGGGIHLYWALQEIYDLRVEFEKIKALRLGMALWYGCDKGLGSPSHKLRVPGTVNLKPNRMRVAEIIRYSPENCYHLSDFPSHCFAATKREAVYDLPQDVLEAARRTLDEAMTTQLSDLASQTSGGRNHALNAKSYWFGRILHTGVISFGQAEALLIDAAARNGLVNEDGINSVRATIRSGLNKGMANPRMAVGKLIGGYFARKQVQHGE